MQLVSTVLHDYRNKGVTLLTRLRIHPCLVENLCFRDISALKQH